MTVREALTEGTRRTRDLAEYDHAKLQEILAAGFDFYPWMLPEELRAMRKGICRDLAIHALFVALSLQPGDYRLIVGDTDENGVPDHAWCEARDGAVWWSDPTNRAGADAPEWFDSLVPQRAYTLALNDRGRPMFTGRLDARKVTRG